MLWFENNDHIWWRHSDLNWINDHIYNSSVSVYSSLSRELHILLFDHPGYRNHHPEPCDQQTGSARDWPHCRGKNAFQLINRNKMAAIAQTTFSNKFSWMKMYQFRLRFHWNLFLRFESTILVQIMAWRRPGDKPLSEPMVFYLTDAYMRHSASVS